MGKFKGIVYLSEEQYKQMYNAKTLNEDTQYVTPDTEQGAVDAYTKAETNTLLGGKQDKLTAGENIVIENNVISSLGGGIPVRNFIEV